VVNSKKGELHMMVADGYAVEAYCGGRITRPHGDMDVYIFVTACVILVLH